MNYSAFKQALAAETVADTSLSFAFGSGGQLAAHFHVTEVAKTVKDFVDCGGTRRTTETCVLQTLVANDVDHRLTAGKLATILEKAAVLGISDESPVEVEVQGKTIELYRISEVNETENGLRFQLGPRQTECLAPDKCGIDNSLSVLGQTDCCDGNTDCC